METNTRRMRELLVGLGDVDMLGVIDEPDGPLVVKVETEDRRRGGVAGQRPARDRHLRTVGARRGRRPPGAARYHCSETSTGRARVPAICEGLTAR